MRSFVTGASGFVGSYLCEYLAARDGVESVICLIRNPVAAERFRARGFRVVEADLQDPDSYGDDLRTAEYVYHVGAQARFGNDLDYNGDNVLATRGLLQALASSACLRRLVFTSTIGAVDRHRCDPCTEPMSAQTAPHPQSGYGRSKLACERLIRESELPWVIVRPSWVYGLGMRSDSHIAAFVRAAHAGKAFTRIDFPGRVSVVHVRDLVIALHHVAEHGEAGRVLFAADASHPRLGTILREIRCRAAPETREWRVPQWVFSALARCAPILPFQARCLVRNVLVCTHGDLEEAGCPPSTPLAGEGLDELVREFTTWSDGRYLVTGAGGGIGAAIAAELARRGKSLYLVDRDDDALERVQAACGGERLAIDLCSPGAARRVLEWTQEQGDPVFALINNAGMGRRGDHHRLSLDDIEDTVRLNATLPMQLTGLFAAEMVRNGAGHIVNIGSSTAGMPLPGMAVYGASKSAVADFSQSIWPELREHGVSVTCVCPSGTRTQFQANAGVKVLNDGRGLSTPDDVASAVIAAMENKSAFVVLGLSSRVLRAITSVLPMPLRARLWQILMTKMR